VRIELSVSGGMAYFPGLNRPTTVETSALAPDETAKVEQLVATADFFALPSAAQPPSAGAADYRTYTLTITDGARSHTIQRHDPVQEPNLWALIQYVQSLGKQHP
jgi:hypothetical protein